MFILVLLLNIVDKDCVNLYLEGIVHCCKSTFGNKKKIAILDFASFKRVWQQTSQPVTSFHRLHRLFVNIIMMQTRNSNSPPQPPEPLPSLPETTSKAHWSEANEIALIDYIADNKAKAGDGTKFKPSFWTDAAKEMLAHTELGGPKTATRCSAKWDRLSTIYLCAIYKLIHLLPAKEVIQHRLYPQS